jgi:plastocyanin
MLSRKSKVRLSNYFAGIAAFCAMISTGCGPQVDLGPLPNARVAAEIRQSFGVSAEDDEAGGAAATTGTGWATLKGRFIYGGSSAPTMPPYDVTKDPATCTIDGKPPLQQTLLVDSATGGIKNVVVYLRDASRVHESAQPKTDSVLYDQKECVFLSHVCALTVGQSLDIRNSDNVGHNTNITGKKNKFNQTIPVGATIAYKVQQEEATPAPVNCSIHPWMSSYLLPRDNAYYAVTAEDGSFEIANLPAGEPLDIQVWHESATGPGGALIVNTPEAKAFDWSNKGRITITLQPDEVKEIQIQVPASAFKG